MENMKYRYILVLSASLLIFISACKKSNNDVSSLYTPTSADVTSTATLQDLQQGRTLYVNNCRSCHGLYSPDDYSSTQWKSIMNSMGRKTGMSASEILLATKYVSRGK